ncbi:hypothetical protein HAX54_001251 [Datura stramonium]|uniref:Uncharacterized protein n=1 Tax=Datura stramonium TaxID=4076 RepID=A0ABS8T462_DATST|nr:hypothetical protein [Datura stramonium]
MGKRTRIPTQKAQETAANGAGQQKKKDTSQIQEGTPVTGAGTTQQPVRTKTTTLGRLAVCRKKKPLSPLKQQEGALKSVEKTGPMAKEQELTNQVTLESVIPTVKKPNTRRDEVQVDSEKTMGQSSQQRSNAWIRPAKTSSTHNKQQTQSVHPQNKFQVLGEPIDWVFVNNEWIDQMPEFSTTFLPEGISDHCPARIALIDSPRRSRKSLKYCNEWSTHPQFLESVQVGWQQEVYTTITVASAYKLICRLGIFGGDRDGNKMDQDFWSIPKFSEFSPERVFLKMYMVESKTGAIACMLFSQLFSGTWPALLSLLERRGRLPQHTYLDYTITNLLAAALVAFTVGQIGRTTMEQPSFITQLSQDNWPSVLFAIAGGVVLSLGNLSTQYAWAFVGLSVTEVITASITVVIGTTLNYYLDDKINKAEILFPGVGCFLIAVCLGSAVHASNAADNKAKLDYFSNDSKNGVGTKCASDSKQTNTSTVDMNDLENGVASEQKAKAGTALFLIEVENKRAMKVFGKSTYIGLAITLFAGACFSLFSPAFNLATNDRWHALKDGVPHLSVYTAFFFFSVSSSLLATILNFTFLYRPVLNAPKSSVMSYVNNWDGRDWALLAGVLSGFGNGLQFMGGQAAGYAAADAVQALPLVSTFWGVILFGEYRTSSGRTYTLLAGMLIMFIAAVAILMASAGQHE